MIRLTAELTARYSLQKEYISKYERALRLIRSRR
jgi:inorganic triphosphatase YgiF